MNIKTLNIKSMNSALVHSVIFSFISKTFIFAQSLFISYAFGVQKSTDVLFYVLSLVVLFSSLVYAVNQQVIIPVAVDIRHNNSEDDSKKFLSYIYLLYLIIGLIGTFTLISNPIGLFGILSNFDIEDIRSNINILTYIILSFTFIVVNTFLLEVFNSYKYFSLPMILDIVKNVIIILFIALLKSKISVTSLAVGVLAGNILQFVVLNVLVITVINWKFTFNYYKVNKLIMKNVLFVIIGQIATFINGFVSMYLLSKFSAGVYSATDYSQKVNMLFSSVLIGQISVVLGMKFIELYSKKDFERLNTFFISYLKVFLFTLIPISCIMAICSNTIISLLFQRGKFDYNAVMLTSEFFKYTILTIPCILVNNFLTRLIIAKQIQKFGVIMQMSNNIIGIFFYYVLIQFLGYLGYPIGIFIFNYLYTFVALFIILKYQFNYISYNSIAKFFVINIVINLIISSLIKLVTGNINLNGNFLLEIIFIIAISVIYLILLTLVSLYVKCNRDVLLKLFCFFKIKARILTT